MKKETQQLVLMLIIGILLGAVGTELWSSKTSKVEAPKDSTVKEITSDKSVPGEKSSIVEMAKNPNTLSRSSELPDVATIPANTRMGLTANDQAAGSAVKVSGFTLVEPRWLVVYDERAGKPSWILGAQRMLPGESGGNIQLLRKTEAGKRYFVAIHNDDGNLEFNKINDPAPEVDKLIIVSFTAQ